MKRLFLSSVITRAGIQTCLVAMVFALMSTGCSGGGSSSGSGKGGGTKTGGGPSPIPVADDHGDVPFDATLIKSGQEITTGFFNHPGDIDYFKFRLVQDQWYSLEIGGHVNGPYNQMLAVDGSLLFQVVDNTGAVPAPKTPDWNFPGAIPAGPGDAGYRIMLQPTYTGDFYYIINSFQPNFLGAYAFKLASTQVSWNFPIPHVQDDFGFTYGAYNKRSYQVIVNDNGELLYIGPAFSGAQAETNYLEGYIEVFEFFNEDFGPAAENWVTFFLNCSLVWFLDSEGVPDDDPQERSWDIHWGIPSGDYADGIDDIFWNDDPVIPGFPEGATNIAFFNQNFQAGTPHPSIATYSFDDPNSGNFWSDDLIHMMLGLDWYADVHITDDYDAYSDPIVASLPRGGVHIADSTFIVNGFEFPQGYATGSFDTLEIQYDDEFQIFYLPYGDIRDHSSYIGQAIHVHSGLPTTANGPLLIDLGVIPPPVSRPLYEPDYFGSLDVYYNTYPGRENVIRELTDAEAKLLTDATYTTGWYVDVHQTPFYVDTPKLRANGVLYNNLEVGAERYIAAGSPQSLTDTRDANAPVEIYVAPTGKVTFVTDDMAFGPIIVKLNGKDIGQIDMAQNAGEVVCGEDSWGQSAVGELEPDTYPYVAYAEGVFWRGHVTLEADGCATVELLAEDAQVDPHAQN